MGIGATIIMPSVEWYQLLSLAFIQATCTYLVLILCGYDIAPRQASNGKKRKRRNKRKKDKNNKNETPRNDRVSPKGRLGCKISGLRVDAYAGKPTQSEKTNWVFEPNCNQCYCRGAQIAGGLHFVSTAPFKFTIATYVHHCCRSASHDGSNEELGVITHVKGKLSADGRYYHAYVDEKVGSFYIQCKDDKNKLNVDTGSVDTEPCIIMDGKNY